MKKLWKSGAITIVLSLLLNNACSLKETPPLHLYALVSPDIKPVGQSPYWNKLLKVSFPLSLKEPLGYKMVYAYGGHERGYYQNSQWSNSLGKLIQGSLIQTLQKSRLFGAVFPFRASVPVDLRLESVVYDLCHYIEGDRSYAAVSIEFSLVDIHSGKLLRRRYFSYKEPTPTADAKGYAAAVNAAMERLSRDLFAWLR